MVTVGVAVLVGVWVAVGVSVGVGVGPGVDVLVAVGVLVGVLVAVGVAVLVGVWVAVGVLVGVGGGLQVISSWAASKGSLSQVQAIRFTLSASTSNTRMVSADDQSPRFTISWTTNAMSGLE